MIILGTYFGGKVKKLDNQWIETKYLLLMVPLIPLSSMFVTGSAWNTRQGFEVSRSLGSKIHGLIRFFTLIGCIVFLYFSLENGNSYFAESMYLPSEVWLAIFGVLLAWSHIECTADKTEDVQDRKKLGAVLGLNALPEWLPYHKRTSLVNMLQQRVYQHFGNTDTPMLVKQANLSIDEVALLYAYLRYQVVDPDRIESTIVAYNTIDAKFNSMLSTDTEKQLRALRKRKIEEFRDDVSEAVE
jgi:hypothetical protein